MVEYKINYWKKSSSYDQHTDTILLGENGLSHLSDNEQIEFTADILTHEYTHKVLYDMFGLTTTLLFDAIQQHFRNAPLHEKALEQCIDNETYQSFIRRAGFNAFLEHYHISDNNFNQAYIICNNRLKGEI